jgi:hypothetical protein
MDDIKYGSNHIEYIPHHFEKVQNRSEQFQEMAENRGNANIGDKFGAV